MSTHSICFCGEIFSGYPLLSGAMVYLKIKVYSDKYNVFFFVFHGKVCCGNSLEMRH